MTNSKHLTINNGKERREERARKISQEGDGEDTNNKEEGGKEDTGEKFEVGTGRRIKSFGRGFARVGSNFFGWTIPHVLHPSI